MPRLRAVERPLLLGHRGARRRARENTLEGFDLCLSHGCDGFEFDVRRSADGELVICHDPRLLRLELAKNNYETLRQCAENRLGCKLARLPDVLASFSSRAFLDIELKVPGVEEAVIAAIREHPPQRGYLVSSFLEEVIERLHAVDASLPLGFIVDDQRLLPRWRELPVSYAVPQWKLVSGEFMKSAHAAGKQVLAWTANQESQMLRLAELGVDGIISDDSERLCRALRRSV